MPTPTPLLHSAAVALAGGALAALLSACSGGSADTGRTGYVPLTTASSAAPAPAPATGAQPPAPVEAPISAPVAQTAPAQAPPTDFSNLARRFVSLRNQGTQALNGIKGQASSSDLAADKAVMAQAATIFGGYASQLRALPFPPSMRHDADTLAQAVAVIQNTFAQASQVSSWDQLNPLLQTLVDSEDAQLAATNVVERDLGLPQSTPRP
jgi:hypothetical protein